MIWSPTFNLGPFILGLVGLIASVVILVRLTIRGRKSNEPPRPEWIFGACALLVFSLGMTVLSSGTVQVISQLSSGGGEHD